MSERLEPEASAGRGSSLRLLIQHAKAGDCAAFDQLMIQSQQRVVALSWRIMGNEEDARDATQEVFLRVYKHLGSFKEDQDFFGWLYRIAVNVCRDMARKRGSRATSWEEQSELHDRLSAENQEDQAYLKQRREMIKRAMASLTEKERIALVLRDFKGFATDEVAIIMNSRPATVRVQISSARTKIKRYCDRLLKKSKEHRYEM